QDNKQMQAALDFLKNGIVSVDIFAMAPEAKQASAAASVPGELSTTFAVGEEAESSLRPRETETAGSEQFDVSAPLHRVLPEVRRGDTERVDVVVRTRKLGHFHRAGREAVSHLARAHYNIPALRLASAPLWQYSSH